MSTFQLSTEALRRADEITIGDLLRTSYKDGSTEGIIRTVSMSKNQLEHKRGKTQGEKNLLLDLIDLINEIGKQNVDKAFSLTTAKNKSERAQRQAAQAAERNKGLKVKGNAVLQGRDAVLTINGEEVLGIHRRPEEP